MSADGLITNKTSLDYYSDYVELHFLDNSCGLLSILHFDL